MCADVENVNENKKFDWKNKPREWFRKEPRHEKKA